MRSFDARWFVSGGWAVDCWLGRQTREHADVDIGLFRDSESAIFEFLPGWHLVGHDTPDATHDEPWDGRPLDFPAHIHARHPDWPELDLNFNERSSGDQWILSRDPDLLVGVAESIRPSAWGVPTATPEVLLWLKGKSEIRPRDEVDFQELLPHLDEIQRGWLAGALSLLDRRHPWLSRLRA